jgi:alanine-synthesizing transaminase
MFSSRTNWHLEPNRFAQALERHRRSGKPLLDLTASNPTTCGFAYPQKEILAALADPRALQYAPDSKGLPEARAAVAEYYRGRRSLGGSPQPLGATGEIDPENILLTSGTSEAYSHIFRLLCEPGDEILVPAPSYPLYEFLANLGDVNLVPYPLVYARGSHDWQMDMAALRAALTPRSRAILLVHPNNPTGSFVRAAEAATLAELCARRDMALVADEVFLDYAHGDATNAAVSAAIPVPGTFAFQNAALTFTLSGLSKICALPQMKLAWMVVSGPPALARAAVDRLEIIADTYLSPGTPVQLAARTLLSLREGIQEQVRQRIAANLAFLDAALLASHGTPGTAAITRRARQGGWYAILHAPDSLDDEEFAVALIEQESVLVHTGHFFDFAQDGFLVLSLIAREAEFQEGVQRLLRFLAR